MSILGRGFPQQAIILQKSAAAGGAITYNTGTTAQATAVAHTTQPTLTIPAGVLNNDVMLVAVSMFTFTPTSPGITLTPTVGSWSPVAGGLKASTASSGFTQFGSVWSRKATGSDAGTTLTFAFTGTPGSTDQFWWSIAIVSYTGAASIDVASDASGDNVSGGVVNACPSISTGAANDWAITIGAIGVNGAGSLTSDPVGTATTRQDVSNSGVCVRITDSNGSVGASGTSIGGSLFGASAATWWIDYTIGLAVATSGTTPISSSDTSNAATEAGSVAAAFTSTDVSNAATESSSESASFTSADVSNAATETNTIKVSSSDASNAATEAGSASASFTATDVSNAAAEAATVSFSSADASNAATETNAVSVGITSTDASNAAVDSSGTVSVSSADPANAATEAGSVHAAFTATDVSNAATETNIVTVSNSDVSNAATETNVVAVSSSDASAAAVEAGSVHAAFTTTDASAAAVDAAVNVAFSSADTSNAATETNTVATGIVITATQGGTTHNGMLLRVKVLTGVALSSPIGDFLGNGSNPQQAALFTTVTGSQVYVAAQSSQSTTLYTANGLTTAFDNFKDTTNGAIYGTGRSTSATGTPGSTTLGFSAPSHAGELCLLEVLPNGTITEDASSPPVATTTTATTVSTASFAPPGGSFIVAMLVTAPGVSSETMSISDTSGLTWTQQTFDAAAGYVAIFTAPFNIIISDSDSFSGADTGSAHAAFTSTDASAAAVDTGAVTVSIFNADTSNAATEAGSVVSTFAISSSDASNAATETGAVTVPISSSDASAAAVDSTGSVHAAFTATDTSNAAAEAGSVHAALTSTDVSNAAVEIGGITKNVSDTDTFTGFDNFLSITQDVPAVFVATSSGSTGAGAASSFNVPVPGAAQVGNLMLIFCATGTGGPPLFTSPGWSSFTPSTPVTSRTGTLLYRVLTGSEGASVPISLSVSALAAGTAYVISGQGTALFDPVPTISGQVNATSTTVSVASVTTADGFNLLVWFGFDGKSGSLGAPPVLSPPTGFTQRGVQVNNTSTISAVNIGMIVADNVINTPGATGAANGSQASSTINGGMLVSIAPGTGAVSVGDFDTFQGTDAGELSTASFSASDSANAAVDTGIVISTNPVSSDASNAATETASVHASFSAADAFTSTADSGTVNNETSTPSDSDSSNAATETQSFSIHITSADASNAAVDAQKLQVMAADASSAAAEAQHLSSATISSAEVMHSVEGAGLSFAAPLTLRGAKVVTTGAGAGSLVVPAQPGTAIGDLIMVYVAGGWSSTAPWQPPDTEWNSPDNAIVGTG